MYGKIVFRSCCCGAHQKCIIQVWGVKCDCPCHIPTTKEKKP